MNRTCRPLVLRLTAKLGVICWEATERFVDRMHEMLEWRWLDEKMGVGQGWGLLLTFCFLSLLIQPVVLLLQLACPLCLRSVFVLFR